MKTNYLKAYKEGIEAARRAEAARREIASVFTSLNEQLAIASDGKLLVQIRTMHDYPEGLGVGQVFSRVFDLKLKEYKALAVVRTDAAGFAPREIARWTQDPDGYPCRIQTAKVDVACGDQTALEAEIEALLGTVAAGEAFIAANEYVEVEAETDKTLANPTSEEA